MKKTKTHHHSIVRIIGIILAVILLLVGIIFAAFKVSPWPESMLIRYEFQKNAHAVSDALQKHVPAGVASTRNLQYIPGDKDAFLDVYYPATLADNATLPTIVWTHGGAWVSGNKNNIGNYAQVLAAQGFTVVAVNYSIAPEKKYPRPIIQLNEALGYLALRGAELHINTENFVLAGDSAGSQISAQMATIITNPTYANEMAMTPNIAKDQLKAMLLNCGAYDLALPDYNGAFGGFLHTVLWAYSGKKDFLNDDNLRHASVVNYVTADFPPSFITAGNGDPLEPQSTEFAAKLQTLGVPTSPLFYPADYSPSLPHEYQFNLDVGAGQQALVQMVTFLKSRGL